MLKERVLELHRNEKLVHAYLVEGAKVEFAEWMAQLVFCGNSSACGECSGCRRIANRNHPDVHFLEPNGQAIKIDQIRELKKEAAYKGVESSKQMFVIVGADKLNVQASNALLKFIEEPSQDSLILLLADNKQLILPTILSRVQTLKLKAEQSIEELAIAKGFDHKHLSILSTVASSVDEIESWGDMADEMVEVVKSTMEMDISNALLSVQTTWAEVFTDKSVQLLSIKLLQSFIKAAWSEKKGVSHAWGDSVKGYRLTEIIEMNRAADELQAGFYSNQHYLLGLERFFLTIPHHAKV